MPATNAETDVLLELAAKCEQATGPDRELDTLIWRQLNGYADCDLPVLAGCVPNYTGSVDAALTLVPSTHYWSAGTIAQDGYEHYDDMDFAWGQVVHRERGESINIEAAATPAIALCAASLRARSSLQLEGFTQ